MESKKIKKSPKSTKKKTSSPPSAISPLKDNDESIPSPENINNDKLNNNKINSPIKEKKEGNTEKKEEKENKEEKEGKNELKKQIEENMALDFDETENFNPLFFRELNYFPPIIRDKESPNDRISSALKKMEKGDDMDILNELINLREFLSMSSERIGYNPSIGKLLEEICKNLTKTYLPEMIIYSLQCINYIIDINPSLVSILKKINAISPIMNTITSVEDITCVDHIIKIFEKISMQNSRILLENKVMETFLVNIFDFLNIYQKKSVMKICYYITNKRISLEEYNLYIKPTMNILVNLIFFDDNDERENLFIVEKATNIFYNILNQIKNEFIFKSNDIKEKEEKNEKEVNNSNNNNDDIVDEIIKSYNIIENFKLILDKFFLKNSKIISEQLIQYILRTIVLILELSQEGINKIFSNKFLELISEIINIEFISEPQNNNNNNNLNNDNINNNVINIISRRTINNLPQNKRFSIFSLEFFDIMNSLFPSSKDILYKKNVEDKKILKPENKTYYDIFCQKIFLPLINNVIKKSINITLSNNFIRLISSFINNATKDDIILFLPSKPISQIILKLLNTKKYNSVNDSINLIKCLLDKSPENYIVSFVREGIIENLKNFKLEENLELNERRGRVRGSIFDDDYKKFRKERDRYFRKRKELMNKIKRKRKNKRDKTDNNKDNEQNKDNENNDKTNIDKEKEKEINNDNNKEIKENEKEKEKEDINDNDKEGEEEKEKIIPKERTEMELDDEDKDKEVEEENEMSEFSEKDNQEENEENEENENNEDDNNDKDEDSENDNDDNNEEEEEQEEEEEPEQDNSDKNEEDQQDNDEENENENIDEENNLEEPKEKNNIIELEEFEGISPSPKKEEKLKEKEKNSEKEKDNEDNKEKEKEEDKDKEKEENKDKEKKEETLEEQLNMNIMEIMNKKLEKLSSELNKEKEIMKERLLLSRKRRHDFEDYLMKKNKSYIDLETSKSKIIEDKIKDLIDNYLTEEKIQQFLSLDENKEKIKLIKIKETLSNYYNDILSPLTSLEIKETSMKQAIDILLDENISITLSELESSKILLSFCHFFGPEFISIYDKLKPDNDYQSIEELVKDLKEKQIVPEKKEINLDIFNRLNKFLSFFNEEKINKFISLLNESILGMNNTILNLNDKDRRHSYLEVQDNIRNIRIKINYNEEIFKTKVLKDNIITDESFKTKLCELNMFFFSNKRLILSLSEATRFKTMGIILLATANIPLISNDKYDITFDFYVEIKKEEKKDIKESNESKEEKMIIEKEKEKEDNLDDEDNINMFNDEINMEDDEEEILLTKDKEKDKEKNDSSKKENNEEIKETKEENKKEEIKEKEKEKEIEPEKEIYNIDENITYKEFTEDFIKKYKDVTPNIQFGLSIKPKINDNINLNKDTNIDNANKIVIEIEKEISEEELKGSNYKKYYSPYIDKITNETNYIDFNEYSLIKEYHENILYNKNLYFSKSLCPSLYLLSILNLALIKYPKLFPLQKNIKELKKLFFNLKLDSSIFKMSSYPRKILEESCQNLSHFISNNSNKELTKFQTRLLCFKTSFYPQYKSMINLQNFLKHNNPEILSNHFSVTLKKTMRIKINVEREKIIEHAFNIINDTNFSDFIGYLEFEYKGEIGNGLGPTLEFYTLILDKIKGDNYLWYKTTDGSLYPKLIDEKNISKKNNNLYNIKMFKLLGYIVGRAIYDDRLLDIPLNKVFWDRVLDRGLTYECIKDIDINLYNILQDFIGLIKQKNEYIKKNNIDINNINGINFDDIILYNKCKLSELDIYFTFPGYDIDLKPDGENILLTMNNIEEYINLIYDFIFFKGVNPLINSFKEGFNTNFDINKMQCFTSQEIEENICGSKEIKWEINNLYENLNPEHGYTKQSKIFNDLIKFMCNLNDAQKKKFLIFSTGCSRLPIGGFKSLSPKLTVVKKYCEEGSNPNDFLPTVMTCQNYLKIPEYSRYDILEKKILMAMEEGCNEFSLS